MISPTTTQNAAIAIGQTSPGPLGPYVVIVGYFVGGMPGAIAGMMALATPAELAIPISRMRGGNASAIRGAGIGLLNASSVLMLTTGAQLVPETTPNIPLVAVAIAGFGLLATGRVPPALVVVLAALVGLVLP
jgi:chromate transporter